MSIFLLAMDLEFALVKANWITHWSSNNFNVLGFLGNRFGIVQSKMALVALLSQYNFSVCEKTQIPVKYSKRAVVQCPDGPVYLRMDRRHW